LSESVAESFVFSLREPLNPINASSAPRKKRTPKGVRLRGADDGICAFSGAPRFLFGEIL
jgi:hypothetical protein